MENDKFDARVAEAGDEVGTGEVGRVRVRVVGRDELARADTVVDSNQPVAACTTNQRHHHHRHRHHYELATGRFYLTQPDPTQPAKI